MKSELSESWRSSDLVKKHYGMDVVTNEQKDTMDRVSKFLRKTGEP
jgi:hypothetical protein